jgi:hypothetical protein
LRKSTDGQGEEIATLASLTHKSQKRNRNESKQQSLQTEESGIGNDIYYAASAVSPNANHQVQRVPLFTVDRIAKPVPNIAQRLQD